MEKSEGDLKHLGFVRLLAANAVVILSSLYEYAKQNAGSLKSTVGTAENAVITVVGPVYEKVKGIPEDALRFIDKKVDELAPPVAKKALVKADQVVHKLVEAARGLVQEAELGPHKAIDLVSSFIKNFALGILHVLAGAVNQFPVLSAGINKAFPTISHWLEQYNSFVTKMAARGYPIFGYFPKVPVDDILKAFKPVESGPADKDAGTMSSKSN